MPRTPIIHAVVHLRDKDGRWQTYGTLCGLKKRNPNETTHMSGKVTCGSCRRIIDCRSEACN